MSINNNYFKAYGLMVSIAFGVWWRSIALSMLGHGLYSLGPGLIHKSNPAFWIFLSLLYYAVAEADLDNAILRLGFDKYNYKWIARTLLILGALVFAIINWSLLFACGSSLIIIIWALVIGALDHMIVIPKNAQSGDTK